jgi:hypothetical protein
MRKSLLYICTLTMAFMFVSCQTSTKPDLTAPATTIGVHRPDTPPTSTFTKLTLDGKWSGTVKWKSEYDSGSVHRESVIIQEGTDITMLTTSTKAGTMPKNYGTLEGNTIHMESLTYYDSGGARVFYPARELHISQNGNTITINFEGRWQVEENREGRVSINGTLTRE